VNIIFKNQKLTYISYNRNNLTLRHKEGSLPL